MSYSHETHYSLMAYRPDEAVLGFIIVRLVICYGGKRKLIDHVKEGGEKSLREHRDYSCQLISLRLIIPKVGQCPEE